MNNPDQNKKTNAKILKFGCLPIIMLGIVGIMYSAFFEEKPKLTEEEIAIARQDSISEARNKKLEDALTVMQHGIVSSMNDPESFELVRKEYDIRDSANSKVRLAIIFRGKNAFGAKVLNVVQGTYDFETDNVAIKK